MKSYEKLLPFMSQDEQQLVTMYHNPPDDSPALPDRSKFFYSTFETIVENRAMLESDLEVIQRHMNSGGIVYSEDGKLIAEYVVEDEAKYNKARQEWKEASRLYSDASDAYWVNRRDSEAKVNDILTKAKEKRDVLMHSALS